ncbi:bactericidal permeability-increasing protein-like [Sycon ciliatum]|uniref:bactericidal permeability-increasing protein-like n=1 Tax=Sycon ciliatum TaxID=27933 RepID=UPI0020AA3B69|eukprot:scpid65769/ scgid25223/ Bactericidal permeability-increasing protein
MNTLVLTLLLCLAVGNPAVSGTEPGFRTAITEKGFDYVRSVGIPMLEKQLSGMSISDQKGKASSPIGKIDYTVSSIKGGTMSIPKSSITLASSSGITISASDASLAVKADWHYRMESWPHVSDHGSCDISVSSVSLTFNVVLGKDSSGHATVSAGSCHADIGHMDVKFHGGASWLYNLFSGSIASSLKGSLASQACSQGKDSINKQANKAVETLPVTVNLDKSALINYALIASPAYTSSYLETQHKGEFFLRAAPTAEAPLTPNALPAISKLDNMMYVWLTEYMALTAGYVYFKSNTLHNLITPKMVPGSSPFSLNTTAFKSMIPALYSKYPNQAMTLFLNNTAPMTVKMTSGLIVGSIPATVQVNALSSANVSTEAFVLQADVHFNATIGVKEAGGKTLVVGEAYYMYTDLALHSSAIGNFSIAGLEEGMNALALIGIIPFLNKQAAAGLPLPVVDGVQFTSPVVQLGEGYIVVATDFDYKPSLGVASDRREAHNVV